MNDSDRCNRIFALDQDLYIITNKMSLITQFPDISPKIREKTRMKRSRKAISYRPSALDPIEKTTAQMYERQFRKWHLQLFFTMIIILTIIYLILLNSPWMFNLINSIGVYVDAAALRS